MFDTVDSIKSTKLDCVAIEADDARHLAQRVRNWLNGQNVQILDIQTLQFKDKIITMIIFRGFVQ